MEVLLTFDIDGLPEGTQTELTVSLMDKEGVFLDIPPATLKFVSASATLNNAQRRNLVVERAVASIHAAKAERKAIRYNREQAFDKAEALLTKAEQQVMLTAGSDPGLLAIGAKLRAARERYAAPMDEGTRKSMHASTIYYTRSRDAVGASQRKTRRE